MKKIYNIGEICFVIESEFEIKEEGYLELFRENLSENVQNKLSGEGSEDKLVYHIRVKDFPEVYRYTCKKELEGQRIYEKEGQVFRVFLDRKGKKGFACLPGRDGIKNTQWNLYVTKEGREELPSTKFLVNVMAPEMTLLSYDAVILHASNIQYKGKNILFSAPCQTGKSTQAALWEKHKNAIVVNGDRALLRKKEDVFYAYGLPFCGSSNICKNKEGEVAALVLLEQGKKNMIRRPEKKEAFLKIYQQITNNSWMPKNNMKIIDIVNEMIEKIPVVVLSCRPDAEAVDILERHLKEGGYIDY